MRRLCGADARPRLTDSDDRRGEPDSARARCEVGGVMLARAMGRTRYDAMRALLERLREMPANGDATVRVWRDGEWVEVRAEGVTARAPAE